MQLSVENIMPLVVAALAEDIGAGDLTGNAVIPETTQARLLFVPREPIVLSGAPLLTPLFAQVNPSVRVDLLAADGDAIAAGVAFAHIAGPARALLAGERTALNFLQRMSGVATLTRRYAEAVAGTGARIVDTRKTIPGWRMLDKYAVTCGGGHNHRMGLHDAVLIKDNHIAIAGSVRSAVESARAGTPSGTCIEVECDTLAQVAEAIAAGADQLLLDNMTLVQLREAVALACAAGVRTEASGGVSLETVRAIAETGVDVISVGRLTHSAPAVDIGLDAG